MTSLPIDSYLDQITQKIFSDPPLILMASPGSGKTTRVPAQLLRALRKQNNQKKMIVIVPKRLAAVSAADRIASENNWDLGIDVGYQVRFESKCNSATQLIFMTEGLFLKKVHDPDFWNDVGFMILDEFHERSAHIDLILGLSFERKVLKSDLQIIIMSATLNAEKLKTYFGDFNLIEINQRPYQLKTIYQKNSQHLICDQAFFNHLKTVTLSAVKMSSKDILIFLPGFGEILKAQSVLQSVLPEMKIEFIYGGLSLSDQKRILNKINSSRRILLATNIAESSLTLPDVDCVIDSGLEKIVVREKKMGFSKLEIVRISKFSATQRSGRAARTSDGVCFKMWHEIDDRSLPKEKKPQILSADLGDELLLLSELGTTDFENFSWLDKPPSLKITAAVMKLKKWGLLDSENKITTRGKLISKIPLDLPQALLFYELCDRGLSAEASHLLSKLETVDTSKKAKFYPSDLTSDLDYLFQEPSTENQKKIKDQLFSISKMIPRSIACDLHTSLLEIFASYFPERICLKKTKKTALSASGRGVEFSESSALISDQMPNDYVIILSGFEKSATQTTAQQGFGYTRDQAHLILKKYLIISTVIDYKPESKKFMKKIVQKFGEFIFTETSPETLSDQELSLHWKRFVNDSPSVFLNLNPSYQKLIVKLQFLKSKSEILNIDQDEFNFLDFFDEHLSKNITLAVSDFQDFLNCDFVFYVQDIFSEKIKDYVSQLPDQVELPNGRIVVVDYVDPKAPMLSAKIQDFFQWHHTPKILNQTIPFTIQLLAPNMRPAQITNDLNNFWQNSYKDVRKDLRARYPKHNWPEEPLKS